ncbi:MAG: CGNR zinc finger domain-containing protein [Rubrivivax sp.]|nr:CGNR zinc finger domain-containing protein [Pyrinomonadaceae bacterium]
MAADLQTSGFKLVGGSPSLDFVNTVGGWAGDPENKLVRDAVLREKLSGYPDLVAWGRQAGLLADKEAKRLLRLADEEAGAAGVVFKRGLKLRETIYRLFKSVVDNRRPDPADLEQLNEELLIARGHEKLAYAGGALEWSWNDRAEALDCVLWPLALSAAELLTSGELSRVRQCGGEQCGWLFLDTSRNRSRQWCDMKDCGNLAKVRRFRQRQHGRAQ